MPLFFTLFSSLRRWSRTTRNGVMMEILDSGTPSFSSSRSSFSSTLPSSSTQFPVALPRTGNHPVFHRAFVSCAGGGLRCRRPWRPHKRYGLTARTWACRTADVPAAEAPPIPCCLPDLPCARGGLLGRPVSVQTDCWASSMHPRHSGCACVPWLRRIRSAPA